MLLKVVFLIGLVYAANALSSIERIKRLIQGDGMRPSINSGGEFDNVSYLSSYSVEALTHYQEQDDICGIHNISRPNPEFDKIVDQLVVPFENTGQPFCELAADKVIPVICKLKSLCVDKSRANEFDPLFTFFYARSQISHNESDYFTCKDKGKEISGKIVNPKAYILFEFDYTKDPFLTRELPCKSAEKLIERSPHILQKTDSKIDPGNLVNNINEYFSKAKDTNRICGIELATRDPKIRPHLDLLWTLGGHSQGEFCLMATEKLVPTICELKKYCTVKKLEMDLTFAQMYSLNQLGRNHYEQYVCKDKDGKVILGPVINPKAYTANFDLKTNPVLAQSLPCKLTDMSI